MFCDEKELCVANTWYKKKEKQKVTFCTGGNKSEIDFVLIGQKDRKYLRDVKVIPCELQHRLVVADMDKRKLKKVVKAEQIERRRVWKLKDKETRYLKRELENWSMLMLQICGNRSRMVY